MNELIGLARSGGFVALREAALYVEQKGGAMSTPRNAVSLSTTRELLLLAVEAFDDALVEYTSRSVELRNQTKFSRGGPVPNTYIESWIGRLGGWGVIYAMALYRA